MHIWFCSKRYIAVVIAKPLAYLHLIINGFDVNVFSTVLGSLTGSSYFFYLIICDSTILAKVVHPDVYHVWTDGKSANVLTA